MNVIILYTWFKSVSSSIDQSILQALFDNIAFLVIIFCYRQVKKSHGETEIIE